MHLRDGDPDQSSDPTVTAAEQGRRDRVTQWAQRLRGDKPQRFVPAAEAEVEPTPEGGRPYAHHDVQSADEDTFDMGMIFRPLTAEQASDDADGPSAAP